MRNIIYSFIKQTIESSIDPKEHKPPDWHRLVVGGMWDEIGELQFDFLRSRGLKPEHRLLDIGCGSLRGGVHFVKYLQPGNYFGVDINQQLLDGGQRELEQLNLTHKQPRLTQMGDFNFQSLNQEFDYALAQSVFTHLPLNSITRCVMNIEKVLVPGGQFYATFFENPQGKFNLDPITYPHVSDMELVTYFDQDPYHYDFKTFELLCDGTDLSVEYIGDWNHPRDQKIMVFTKL